MEFEEIMSPDDGVSVAAIRRLSDGACIPANEANTDYQAYLNSLEPEIVEEPVVEEPPVEDPIPETPAA